MGEAPLTLTRQSGEGKQIPPAPLRQKGLVLDNPPFVLSVARASAESK